jgi:hypothetical protein
MPHLAGKKPGLRCGNRLINQSSGWLPRAPPTLAHTKSGGHRCPPDSLLTLQMLDVDDVDDLERARVDHKDLVTDQNVLVTAPLRIDRDDFGRERME